VFEAIHKNTKEHRAIKAISKQNVEDKKVLANDIEIMLLRKLVSYINHTGSSQHHQTLRSILKR
jgi:hypothetical protein